jgi:peptide/nickel transport system ATP-binding protein
MAQIPLLKVENVTKIYESGLIFKRKILALEDISFEIEGGKAEILGIVGESGSGKSTLAKIILRIIKPTKGRVLYKGKDISKLGTNELKEFYKEVNTIFQDPYSSANPLRKVDDILITPIRKFNIASTKEEEEEIVNKALDMVNLRYDEVIGKYPYELSGGQLQRVMLARLFIIKPKLVIADEPVSMIDASLRANILNIILKYKEYERISFIYITHDLSTAKYVCDRIIVLYRGSIVEEGPAEEILKEPLHPYTQLLIESVPVPDPTKRWSKRIDLTKLEETTMLSIGCKFYDRCPYRTERCKQEKPLLRKIGERGVACHIRGTSLI